jgi:hypothetical protein
MFHRSSHRKLLSLVSLVSPLHSGSFCMSLRLAQDRSHGGRIDDLEILIAVVEDRIRAPDTVLSCARA